MQTGKTSLKKMLSQPIIQTIIFTLCLLTIASSVALFITDRGNIIALAHEQLQGWQNPTYHQMKEFIKEDTTEQTPFIEGTYECKQFCIDLIQQARQQGYRAGYVSLQNPIGDDHAIVCFDTKDKGLIFVEPQNDYMITKYELDTMVAYGEYNPGVITPGLEFHTMSLSDYTISWYMII